MKQIRQLQHAYGAAYGFSSVVAGPQGQLLTEPVYMCDLGKWIYERMVMPSRQFRMLQYGRSGEGEALVLDFEDTGLSFVIVPFEAADGRSCFLWSGPLLESDDKDAVESSIRNRYPEAEPFLEHIQTLSSSWPNKKTVKEKSVELADLISVYSIHEFLVAKNTGFSDQFGHLLSRLSEFNGDFAALLKDCLAYSSQIDFLGYAVKGEGNQYQITDYEGEGGGILIGSSFSIGEGYLGQVAITGQDRHWKCHAADPRTKFFASKGIVPTELYCFPIRSHDEIVRVLFFGSVQQVTSTQPLMNLGRLMSQCIGQWISRRDLMNSLEIERSRLTTLMEVSRVITSVRDVRRILFLLVDMALNLIQDSKASLAMIRKHNEMRTAELVTRGLTREQADRHGKRLAHHYWRGESAVSTVESDAAEGTVFLESVLTCHHEIVGVLCVELANYDSQHHEFQLLLDTLAFMGSTALEQTIGQSNHVTGKIELLFESLRQWDPDKYNYAEACQSTAAQFGRFVHWNPEQVELVIQACKLMYYEIDILKKADLPDKLVKLVEHFQALSYETPPTVNDDHLAQALYLMDMHLRQKNVPAEISWIDRQLLLGFQSYLNFQQKQVAHIEVVSENFPYSTNEISETTDPVPEYTMLSPREKEVLQWIAKGKNNKDIAEALFISENTVKNHITSIFNKMGVTDRIQLMTIVLSKR
ncbi:helix-turn-helix transcriptional regulator [Marinicrinis lubricantis]|uniref:LuxR C-terminal-related transcriptional regulator n=1 Tax=Marinicrinis lubricantis TaxID=2086470 RepID=A0ABW1IM94_9BACL